MPPLPTISWFRGAGEGGQCCGFHAAVLPVCANVACGTEVELVVDLQSPYPAKRYDRVLCYSCQRLSTPLLLQQMFPLSMTISEIISGLTRVEPVLRGGLRVAFSSEMCDSL